MLTSAMLFVLVWKTRVRLVAFYRPLGCTMYQLTSQTMVDYN